MLCQFMSVTLYFVALNWVCCILRILKPPFMASTVSCVLNSRWIGDKFGEGETMCRFYVRPPLYWLIPGLRHIIHVHLPGWAYFCLWQSSPGAGWTCINKWLDYVLGMGTPRTFSCVAEGTERTQMPILLRSKSNSFFYRAVDQTTATTILA